MPSAVVSLTHPGTLEITSTLAADILQNIPGAELIGATDEAPIVRVPWDQQTVEALTAIRAPHIPAIARPEYGYVWSGFDQFGGPMQHQYRMAGFLASHKRGFCLGEPGTAKTSSAVWAADFLIRLGAVTRVLVVCPVTLMQTAWVKEINTCTPHHTVEILHGAKLKRLQALGRSARFDIINFDGVEVIADELKSAAYDLVIIDESTAYKNINQRFHALYPIAKASNRLWLLTGTPTPQSPEDAYGQIKMIYGKSWEWSKEKWKYATMQQISPFKWIPKKDAAATVRVHMQPAVFVSKREAMPYMPPIMHMYRKVALSTEQVRLIKKLKQDSLAATACGVEITAAHAAALQSKIIQIASGAVYTGEDKTVVTVDNAARLSELLDIVQQTRSREYKDGTANNKVIVFVAFKHTAAVVAAYLSAAGFAVATLTGDSTVKQRQDAIHKVQDTPEIEVLVAISDIAAHGITLTAATTTVWFSPITRAENYNQANNRMDRPGQKQHMEVIHLYAHDAENMMYNSLSNKLATQVDILSGYKQLVDYL
jgi:SNF2 family DNA or RNA helicase